MTTPKDLQRLERMAQLLRQDADMAKLGLESQSHLQQKIDAALKRFDADPVAAAKKLAPAIEAGGPASGPAAQGLPPGV